MEGRRDVVRALHPVDGQGGQLVHDVAGHDVGADREHLAELDEGRTEVDEDHAQAAADGDPGVVGVAVDVEPREAGELAKGADCDLLAKAFWIGWEGAVMRAKLEHSAHPLRIFISTYLQGLPR